MVTIRPYQKKDFRYVQDVCFETAQLGNHEVAIKRAILCNLYCDYYLDCEPDYCLVAVDEKDIPIGYILCSVDLDTYHEQMTENYLPLVRKLSGNEYFRFSAEMKLEQRYIKQGYTAHLHFDVLDEYQQQDVDVQLLNAMLKKLADSFVEGAYYLCGLHNEKVKEFFVSNGFEDIDYLTNTVVFAKKLFSDEE